MTLLSSSRLAAALALACLLSACGGSDHDEPPATDTPTQPGEPGTPPPAPQLRCAA
ncbi:hypothetical protein ANDO1_4238 [plant metagenome]|uniref:Uncharacterized protein n=1 Tax=plant metagenome TaxID=1297885 RepID=A0A484PJQ7_9ZZZZ